ncbi:hypothetical protein E2C01_044070 [Portunus trituberculatus]|uniref:Uncharacterized protein n=1 Tax=Portunus trituberculatus TaxID=210409 RepID=A0A5B7FXD8_PORTR|nr:hypothetical protein [Portunus trituberculatus]
MTPSAGGSGRSSNALCGSQVFVTSCNLNGGVEARCQHVPGGDGSLPRLSHAHPSTQPSVSQPPASMPIQQGSGVSLAA